MYNGFAEVYDELMRDVDYRSWAEFYVSLMNQFGITGGKLCECACGTGALSIPLYKHGFHVTGVDLSQEMLWIASQKARKEGIAIPFVRQNMCELRLHRPMDAVLATCDGVNYLLKDEEALAFFKAAFAALRPGGGLFFDVSTPHKLSHDLGNQTIVEDGEHITFFWQNDWHARNATIDMRLSFFVKEKDGTYRRIDEEQTQRAYESQALTDLLYKVGFEKVYLYGNKSLSAPKEGEERWFFAAIKRAEQAPA